MKFNKMVNKSLAGYFLDKASEAALQMIYAMLSRFSMVRS